MTPLSLYRKEVTSAGLTLSVAAGLLNEEYEFYTSGVITLVGNVSISFPIHARMSGKTLKKRVRWTGRANLGTSSIDLNGVVLTQEQAISGNVLIDYSYNGTAWVGTIVTSENSKAQRYEGVKKTTLPTGGSTKTLDPTQDKTIQQLVATGTWTANTTYSLGGTPLDGDEFEIQYDVAPGFDPNSNQITLAGVTLTPLQTQYGGVIVRGRYDAANTNWLTMLYQNPNALVSMDMINKEVSFEASQVVPANDEMCNNPLFCPYPAVVVGTRCYVTDAIEGSDDANIDIYINGVQISDGSLLIPAGSPKDTLIQNTPSAMNIIGVDSKIEFRATKLTKGGRVFCQLIVKKTV